MIITSLMESILASLRSSKPSSVNRGHSRSGTCNTFGVHGENVCILIWIVHSIFPVPGIVPVPTIESSEGHTLLAYKYAWSFSKSGFTSFFIKDWFLSFFIKNWNLVDKDRCSIFCSSSTGELISRLSEDCTGNSINSRGDGSFLESETFNCDDLATGCVTFRLVD